MGTSAGAGSMKKWAMIVDVAKCINCNNCVLATKDEHIGNEFPGYAAPQPAHGHEWISIERHTRGSGSMVDVSYVPTMCNHCDDAPCVKAAGDGAVYKRSDGDAHLLDQGWTKPRCVQACPTGALESMHVSDENMQALAAREGLEVLRPEFSTKPRVFYRNLRRTYQCFIGGNVFRTRADGSQENVEGARVELSIDGVKVGDAQTDRFGDFKIDGLQGNAAKYRLRIFHNAFGQAEATGVLHKSDYRGAIPLTGRTS